MRLPGIDALERPETWLGIEPDECYYRTDEKIATATWSVTKDTSTFPASDLAIEVDAGGAGLTDFPSLYATLGVPEVRRFDGEVLHIGNPVEQGTYEQRTENRFLPIAAEGVARWGLDDLDRGGTAWARRLQVWPRADVLPRAARPDA